MFPTGLSSPNPPPPPTQEARPASADVKGDSGSITSPKKRKINGSEREESADTISASSPPKTLFPSSSSSSASSTPLHIQKKLRFEDSVDFIGLDVKMAEEAAAAAAAAASCSNNKSKAVFLTVGVGHHANGLSKTAGSGTFSNSKPGASKKLVIKNFKGSPHSVWCPMWPLDEDIVSRGCRDPRCSPPQKLVSQ